MRIMMHGMTPPVAYQSKDKTWFYAVSAPVGGAFQIWREYLDSHIEQVKLPQIYYGKGSLCLQADGSLWAVVGELNGSSPVTRFLVPGWKKPGFLNIEGLWMAVLGVGNMNDNPIDKWNNLRSVLRKNTPFD